MTKEELCSKLGVSASTIETNFPRTKERYLEKGIIIRKEGRGKNAEYFLEEMYEGCFEKAFSHKLSGK